MSYQALYRQWRPIDFDEVIGQDHIVSPLRHQISTHTCGHAYLFSGTRGTGKTSTAKIFARAVNCLSPINGNPCNSCENCISILEDQFIDVVEMDAASNNSVDDIRELREHVKFAPSKGKYKVYIVDEVHMLSQGAFNALLKTLEEPPEYVMFLLATTEIQKIPATILSRCQRYEFKRVSYEQLQTRLEMICKKMNIEFESEALKLIIEKSDGAVRDSLSGLDQCLSNGSNKLTVLNVIETLGIVEKAHLLLMVQLMSQYQFSEVLTQINSVLQMGKDINQFLNGLIEVYRDLLIVKMVTQNHNLLIQASEEYIESLRDTAQEVSSNQISRTLDSLIDLSKSLKFSQNKRIIFEATILRVMSPETEHSLEALTERVEKLEKSFKSGIIKMDKVSEALKKSDVLEMTTSEANEPLESFVEFTDKEIHFEDLELVWSTFIETVRTEKKSLAPCLEGAKPTAIKGSKCLIELLPENKLFMSILNNISNSSYLNQLISQLLKKNMMIEYTVNELDTNKDDENVAQIMDFFKDYKDVLEIKK